MKQSDSLNERNDSLKLVADQIFDYLRTIIYHPAEAPLELENLPESFDDVGKGLKYLNSIIRETRALANELAAGNLDYELPPPGNEMAAPLKHLHSSLKHLTWQAQLVAKGNYNQRVDFMGEFSEAFNDMISQLKQREQDVMAEKARLKSFLATMSHEIRTPMNAIIGMTELALRDDLTDTAREHMGAVKQAGGNLLTIINNILDFSKIESGQMEIVPEKYQLSSLISDVIDIVRMRILDSRLHFIVDVDSRIPNALFGDALRINQVILNILNNAIKYTDTGHVSLSIRSEGRGGDTLNLIIEIADSGRGIKEENLVTLFEEFSQFDLEKNKGIEGTGLGLSITYNLVKAMNGDIEVSSEYGKGSIFTVIIPQTVISHDEIASVENPSEKSVIVFEKSGILRNSIAQTLAGLNVPYKCIASIPKLNLTLTEGFYTHLFVTASVYKNDKAFFEPFQSQTKIVIIADARETLTEKELTLLTVPLYSIPIANLLNGIMKQSRHESEAIAYFTAPSARVLIVDDINMNLQVAKGLMEPYHMQIDLRENGREAVEAAFANHYDLIFMDQMMPEMNGIEAVKKIREKGATMPIVALTANVISGTKEMLLDSGFNDFLSKPIRVVKLHDILEKWIPPEKIEDKVDGDSVGSNRSLNNAMKITGVDIDKGIARSGGDFAYYLRILAIFNRDATKKMEQINICLATNDLPLYTTHIHGLKSACATIGAEKLSKSAKDLENAGRQGNHAYITAHNQQFIDKLSSLHNRIELFLADQT